MIPSSSYSTLPIWKVTFYHFLINTVMKKVILTAVAALALVATSFAQSATAPAPKAKMTRAKPAMDVPAQGTPAAPTAQGAPTAEQSKGKGHDRGEARGEGQGKGQGGMNALGLSPDQETKFKAANQAHKAAVKAVQMDASLAADAKKAQVAALVTKYQSDVQGIMNADQFAKWTAMRAKRSERKEGGEKEDGDHKEGGDHKKGGHKADGAATTAPADGSAPVQGVKMVKRSKH
jgi:hypothetical protein